MEPETFYYDYLSPIGNILLASRGSRLCGLWFYGQKYFPEDFTVSDKTSAVPDPVVSAERWLDLYFSGIEPGFTPDIEITGTDFEKKISRLLLEIPYGTTMSYKDLAACAGTSPRAAGHAVSRNRISIIVPCHRIISSTGALTGYAGGTDKKAFLLNLEKCSFLHQ